MACCFGPAEEVPPGSPPFRRGSRGRQAEVAAQLRHRCRPSTAAGAAVAPHLCSGASAPPPQVEELRQQLSRIMPPLEVGWQDATVNTTRLPSAAQPATHPSPFGAFERRHSMRQGAAQAQQGRQQSPQADEQLHGDSRTASGGRRACRCSPRPCLACTPADPRLLPPPPLQTASAGGLQWTDSRKLLEAAIAMEQMGTIHEDVAATPSGKGWGWGGGGWTDGALDAAEQRLQARGAHS